MSKLNDFVYMSIYRGAIAAGASERVAKDEAIMGLEDYKKGKFNKAKDLIEERVKAAKQRIKYDSPAGKRNDKQRANPARA